MPGFALDDPRYLNADTDNDALMRMLLELASEVWVLRDRQILLESALRKSNTLTADELDAPITDPELRETVKVERDQLITRLIAAASNRYEVPATS
ncbi:hypothetical protein [Rhodococcus sp. IEGM 1379]|uniref:hypothetical protein n=1 Tax=Rhodococcus sp. IEGM 1379 TaxID=3047086 RepID=UPI0024B79076|nr:hypothetical protein [Rhodococcus sp. IEGM 1379]MDI9915325.1 hypothetical protein [Rhodococcus sp. IEGM 1379]